MYGVYFIKCETIIFLYTLHKIVFLNCIDALKFKLANIYEFKSMDMNHIWMESMNTSFLHLFIFSLSHSLTMNQEKKKKKNSVINFRLKCIFQSLSLESLIDCHSTYNFYSQLLPLTFSTLDYKFCNCLSDIV